MGFDEVLRKADQERQSADAVRDSALREQRAEALAEDQFREELREFGRWFAAEAKARRLPSKPFLAVEEVAVPGVRRGLFRHAAPASRVKETVTVGRGWEIFPASPWTGGPHLGRAMEYDERWEHGDLVSSKQAYLCLAVDAEDGQVCVGASTKEGTIVSGIDVRLVGAEPDALTRSDVLYHVAALGESISLARDPEGMARDDAAMKANANTEDRLVALYAAEAKRMLTQP